MARRVLRLPAMVRRALALGLVLALGACGSKIHALAPVPIREQELWVGVPAAGGRGDIRIVSQGVRRVLTSSGAQVDALLVRMIVTNDNGARPWTVDTREQFLQLPTGVRTPPLQLQPETAVNPVIRVPCGTRRVIDLYYVEPPAGLASLPAFEVLWQVNTGEQLVSLTSTFTRVASSYVPDRPVVALRDAPVMISRR
ncbi:MAG: hypothetical protein SFX73_36835 [Kofleriaceae bacterium]|nr:hypothetical protein [Kofleriaceae bacterium]